MISCNTERKTPPTDVFKENGNCIQISTASLLMDEAYKILKSFGIENDYSQVENDVVAVYFTRSEELDKYYEIYYPLDSNYEVIVRETSIPDFSVVQAAVYQYIQLNDSVDIELYDNYQESQLFPQTFDDDFNQWIGTIGPIDSPIILKVGFVNLETSSPNICLAKYSNNSFVIFYNDIEAREYVIIQEINL